MRLSDLYTSGLKAYPATQGKILEPNKRWFLPVEVSSVRLPPSSILQEGDWIELIPSIEPSLTVVQIIDDSRLIRGDGAPNGALNDKNNPLRIGTTSTEYGFTHYSLESAGVATIESQALAFRWSGHDWQPLQWWTNGQSNAARRTGRQIFTQSGYFDVPAGVTQIVVDVIAAGGGGGAGAIVESTSLYTTYATSGGSGGGGGGAVIGAKINVTSGQRFNFLIGSKGFGGKASFPASSHYLVASNGEDGSDAGNTSFENLIVVEGGKRGKGGTYAENASALGKTGGSGGRVLTNLTNGTSFEGGKGGDSGMNGQNSQNGQSVNGFAGGVSSATSITSRDSRGGGGGASAKGDGGDELYVSAEPALAGSPLAGSQFGGGGAGRHSASYSASSDGNSRFLYAGDGGAGAIIISWSI